ncbi:molybdopterin-guanine dinucleotide biosynthesis protein A [Humibacillus xanthopallidus]|uniref:Molybdopterin-guanine dinucleotide biosynthesis protein A n=1 Tax=Humibacillus xanthopallidus TaxID=412689 RepID=A0A543PKU4_9MICO|nr:molybdopterin-guanine dinucleotide biosynthesis protein A [Humibacillus xanthopallidus]
MGPACQTPLVEPSPPVLPYAVSVLVLTGGASRRMGSHKPSLEVGGLPMVVRVLEAARPRPVLVVGRADDVPDGIPRLVEDPPGGGPVAAIAAGVRQLPAETEVVVVLAADLPFVSAAHLDRLVSAATCDQPAAGAVTVDAAGRRNWLCSAWPRAALAAALDRLEDPSGRSMRDLAAGLRPREVADLDGVADDVDTPSDLEEARRRDGAEGSPT